ncbi:MAG: hypothetical protein KF905_15420 [Flavobacteriales bacterium]|nr:hypothetical protein [Flavobacteriales bacterium]
MTEKMLAYYQDVLERISTADPAVFRKELRKAFNRLLPEQREELKAWFRTNCACRVQQATALQAVRSKGTADRRIN